jgi:hypothetical protein
MVNDATTEAAKLVEGFNPPAPLAGAFAAVASAAGAALLAASKPEVRTFRELVGQS